MTCWPLITLTTVSLLQWVFSTCELKRGGLRTELCGVPPSLVRYWAVRAVGELWNPSIDSSTLLLWLHLKTNELNIRFLLPNCYSKHCQRKSKVAENTWFVCLKQELCRCQQSLCTTCSQRRNPHPLSFTQWETAGPDWQLSSVTQSKVHVWDNDLWPLTSVKLSNKEEEQKLLESAWEQLEGSSGLKTSSTLSHFIWFEQIRC